MKNLTVCLMLLFTCAATAQNTNQIAEHDPDWFSTFSIIAFDPATSELGVAVQSRAFGAGAAVPYAKAGVGAVATQAAANRSYGPKAIAMLEQGMSPAEAVKKMVEEDPGKLSRQVAVIDTKGRTAVYTSPTIDANGRDNQGNPAYAGSIEGKNYSVQGNTLASEEVVKAMARAYETTEGPMADRLMAALDAGQSKGGDRRGMQSAGILVVRPVKDPNNEVERIVDLRVDDAENPFKELHRLLDLRAANTHTQRSTQLAQQNKFAEALAEQKMAAEKNPRSEQVRYALAQRYAQAGEYLNALASLEEAIRMQPRLKQTAAAEPAFAKLKEFVEFQRLVAQ
jgi:uncharacterized Ntn-hydrolase superfamily protein